MVVLRRHVKDFYVKKETNKHFIVKGIQDAIHAK